MMDKQLKEMEDFWYKQAKEEREKWSKIQYNSDDLTEESKQALDNYVYDNYEIFEGDFNAARTAASAFSCCDPVNSVSPFTII